MSTLPNRGYSIELQLNCQILWNYFVLTAFGRKPKTSVRPRVILHHTMLNQIWKILENGSIRELANTTRVLVLYKMIHMNILKTLYSSPTRVLIFRLLVVLVCSVLAPALVPRSITQRESLILTHKSIYKPTALYRKKFWQIELQISSTTLTCCSNVWWKKFWQIELQISSTTLTCCSNVWWKAMAQYIRRRILHW